MRSSRTASADVVSTPGWTTRTLRTRSPSRRGSSPSRWCPTTTSYGCSPPTVIDVGSSAIAVLLRGRWVEDVQDEIGHLARARPVREHARVRDLLVDRAPGRHQGLPLGSRVAQQQWARRAEPDPRGRDHQRDVEKDDGATAASIGRQRLDDARVEHGATAEGQDAVVLGQVAEHRLPLQLTEGRLAVDDEDAV